MCYKFHSRAPNYSCMDSSRKRSIFGWLLALGNEIGCSRVFGLGVSVVSSGHHGIRESKANRYKRLREPEKLSA